MLAEGRRRQPDMGGRLAHAPVRTFDLPVTGHGVRDGLEEVPRAQVLVLKYFGHAQDGHGGNTRRLKGVGRGLLRLLPGPRLDGFIERLLVAMPADDISETLVPCKSGLPEGTTEGRELSIVLTGDSQPLVLAVAGVTAVRCHRGMAVAPAGRLPFVE